MSTHNTREGIEDIEHQTKTHIAALLGYLQQIHDSGQYHCAEIELEKVLENVELLTKTHHQELQKAREGLLKDILEHKFTDSWNCEAVYVDTIKRLFKDQSELDQLNK